MKTDNLFRFVSIRPPGGEETIERVPGDDGIIDEVGRILTHNLGRRGTTRSEAAQETGHEIISSPDYFLAQDWGSDLLAATRHVRRLLKEAEKGDADWKAFQREGQKIRDDIAPDIERTLWRSYFAAVLSPSERPKDAESIASWLVLHHLLKSDSGGEFSKRAEKLNRMRISAPASFFFDDPAQSAPEPAPPPPPEKPDPGSERAEDVRREITRLQDARRELDDLLAERLRAMSSAERPSALMKAERGSDSEERSPAAAGHGTSVTFESAQQVGWKFTADDFQDRAELVETIRSAGIVPELATIPDAINHMDTRIALLNADLAQLNVQHEIAIEGNTFVRLRRARDVAIREVPQ